MPQLGAPWSAHWASGSWPAATSVQAPAVPVRLQERQRPVQALMQQAPCSQKPLAHSVVLVQAAPFGFFEQMVPLQVLGNTQSELLVQLVRQVPFVPHMKAPQLPPVTVRQVPAPSQVRAGVNMVPMHIDAAQVVPLAYDRQPPEPSQNPSVPQLADPWSVHWFSGSWPAGTLVHVPTVPASAHD